MIVAISLSSPTRGRVGRQQAQEPAGWFLKVHPVIPEPLISRGGSHDDHAAGTSGIDPRQDACSCSTDSVRSSEMKMESTSSTSADHRDAGDLSHCLSRCHSFLYQVEEQRANPVTSVPVTNINVEDEES